MLKWLFQKQAQAVVAVTPFQYGEALTLDWDEDCEAWTCALPELAPDAGIVIGPRAGVEHPTAQSCAVISGARERIVSLNAAALDYLVHAKSEFIRSAYKHSVAPASFTPTGIELFEHEDTPGEFSLSYDPVFDPGAVWRVRFNSQQQPFASGFDD